MSTNAQPVLNFGEPIRRPRARTSDPETSHEAAQCDCLGGSLNVTYTTANPKIGSQTASWPQWGGCPVWSWAGP